MLFVVPHLLAGQEWTDIPERSAEKRCRIERGLIEERKNEEIFLIRPALEWVFKKFREELKGCEQDLLNVEAFNRFRRTLRGSGNF